MKYFNVFIFLFVFFCIEASQVYADNFKITEIMYDPESTDTGREWIEVVYLGSSAAPVKNVFLFEDESRHTLSHPGIIQNIEPNSTFVIADNIEKFKIDWPQFTGLLFDSSFSLKNTGENLKIQNGEGSIFDSIDYLPDQGGNGNGKSLHRKDNVFEEQPPDPGTYSGVSSNSNTATSSSTSSSTSTITSSNTNNSNSANQNNSSPGTVIADSRDVLKITIQSASNAMVGTPVRFSSQVLGLSNTPISGGEFLWSFGDGTSSSSKQPSHMFKFPGTYLINLSVKSGDLFGSTNIKINITRPDVSISQKAQGEKSTLIIKNNATSDLLIEFFKIRQGSDIFMFPSNTFISGKSEIVLDETQLGFLVKGGTTTDLLLPNEEVLISIFTQLSQESLESDQLINSEVAKRDHISSIISQKITIEPVPKSVSTKIKESALSFDYDQLKDNDQNNIQSGTTSSTGASVSLKNGLIFLMCILVTIVFLIIFYAKHIFYRLKDWLTQYGPNNDDENQISEFSDDGDEYDR